MKEKSPQKKENQKLSEERECTHKNPLIHSHTLNKIPLMRTLLDSAHFDSSFLYFMVDVSSCFCGGTAVFQLKKNL